MSDVAVHPVETRRQLRAFIDLPHALYAGQPAYVPRLHLQQKAQLSRGNPYFRHSEAAYWLAVRGGRPVGRVAWFLNARHVARGGRREAFFGLLDVEDDAGAARALLDAVEARSRERGCDAVLGPIEFSTNDTCGLLVDGFDLPPAILMPWNPAWLPPLVLGAGYRPAMELLAYDVTEPPARVDGLAARLAARLARRGITVRPIDFGRRFEAEVARLFPLYERIYGANWGFMPLTEAEFAHQARDLRQASIPDLALVAEDRGAPIGYAVAVFDANRVLARFRRGRLLPLNVLALRKIPRLDRIKILNLGVVPSHRGLGVDALMYAWYSRLGARRGIVSAEASYVLASNAPMRRALERMNARVTKRYAIYRKDLSPEARRADGRGGGTG